MTMQQRDWLRLSASDALFTGPPPVDLLHPLAALVADAFAVDRAALLSRRVALHISRPRQVLMWILVEAARWSSPRIGRALDRHHSTVVLGRQSIERLREADPAFRARTDRLRERATIRIVDLHQQTQRGH